MKASRFCPLVVLCAIFLWNAGQAHAQTTVYINVDASQYSFSQSSNDQVYEKVGVGFEGGVIQYFPSSSRLKAGIDVRGLYGPGARGGGGAFGSLRIAFVPHRNVLSPYLEIGGGVLNTRSTPTGISATGGAADFDFGLNVRVGSRFAVRALEIGGYAGSSVGLSTIGFGVLYNVRPGRQ